MELHAVMKTLKKKSAMLSFALFLFSTIFSTGKAALPHNTY